MHPRSLDIMHASNTQIENLTKIEKKNDRADLEFYQPYILLSNSYTGESGDAIPTIMNVSRTYGPTEIEENAAYVKSLTEEGIRGLRLSSRVCPLSSTLPSCRSRTRRGGAALYAQLSSRTHADGSWKSNDHATGAISVEFCA